MIPWFGFSLGKGLHVSSFDGNTVVVGSEDDVMAVVFNRLEFAFLVVDGGFTEDDIAELQPA